MCMGRAILGGGKEVTVSGKGFNINGLALCTFEGSCALNPATYARLYVQRSLGDGAEASTLACGVELLPDLDDIVAQLRASIDLKSDLLIATENGRVVSITELSPDLAEGALRLLSDDVHGNVAG